MSRNAPQIRVTLAALGLAASVVAPTFNTASAADKPARNGNQMSTDATQKRADDDKTLAEADRHFVQNIASANMLQMKWSELAAKRASSPEARNYATTAVETAKKVADHLDRFAKERGLTLPQEMSGPNQASYDDNEKLEGEPFTRSYLFHQAGSSEVRALQFEFEATQSKDEKLRQMAAEVLPTLQQQQKSATRLAHEVAVGKVMRASK